MMYLRTSLPLALSFLLLPLACGGGTADTSSDSDEGSGGTLDNGPGTGGAGAGGTASGGAATGGSGLGATGGTASGGAGNPTGGTGTGGSGTGGGVANLANPSPGCAQAAPRPSGGKVYKAGDSWLIFPEKYDGVTPLPVLFGFHGCGEYNFGTADRTEYFDATRGSGFETDYVVAAPLADSGSCYEYGVDIVRAKAVYDDLVNNYCVDMDRVFGTGHSSGAGFLTSMLISSNKADFDHFGFKGMAPVSSWDMEFSTQVPMMYIQGVTDSERGGGDGKNVVDKIVAAHDCSTETTAYAVDSCNSSHDSDPVNAGCKSYNSCGVPTIWCSHDDSAYSGTFHGIPCFYKQAMYDFFASL